MTSSAGPSFTNYMRKFLVPFTAVILLLSIENVLACTPEENSTCESKGTALVNAGIPASPMTTKQDIDKTIQILKYKKDCDCYLNKSGLASKYVTDALGNRDFRSEALTLKKELEQKTVSPTKPTVATASPESCKAELRTLQNKVQPPDYRGNPEDPLESLLNCEISNDNAKAHVDLITDFAKRCQGLVHGTIGNPNLDFDYSIFKNPDCLKAASRDFELKHQVKKECSMYSLCSNQYNAYKTSLQNSKKIGSEADAQAAKEMLAWESKDCACFFKWYEKVEKKPEQLVFPSKVLTPLLNEYNVQLADANAKLQKATLAKAEKAKADAAKAKQQEKEEREKPIAIGDYVFPTKNIGVVLKGAGLPSQSFNYLPASIGKKYVVVMTEYTPINEGDKFVRSIESDFDIGGEGAVVLTQTTMSAPSFSKSKETLGKKLFPKTVLVGEKINLLNPAPAEFQLEAVKQKVSLQYRSGKDEATASKSAPKSVALTDCIRASLKLQGASVTFMHWYCRDYGLVKTSMISATGVMNTNVVYVLNQ